jgi:hypothetical protein
MNERYKVKGIVDKTKRKLIYVRNAAQSEVAVKRLNPLSSIVP